MKERIWFTSDSHYNHKNIVLGVSDWKDKTGCRDFKTLEEHNQALVNNINACVKEEDTLYHAGDWSFGGLQFAWDFRKQIKCKNIILTLGNHDQNILRNRQIIIPKAEIETYDELGLFWDSPFDKTHLGHYTSVKNLFTLVNNYLELTVEKQKIILSHYPIGSWNLASKGSWMLHGHCHGSYPEQITKEGKKFSIIDIGVDTHKEFRPYSFEEIKEKMKQTIILNIDHHERDKN